MVSYDFGCIENDTIGFTNGKYTKNGGSNPAGVVVKLYSASSRYPQSLSDYTEIGSATADLMGINLTGTALKGAQYLFYGAGEERVFIASYYAYGELTSVQLTTNKNTISHADNEKALLTATIKDGDGETIHLEDKLVTFYKQTIKSTQNSITITGEDTTTLENSTNNNGDKITFTVTNPTAAIALLFDETKTVSLRNLATNDKITTEHINGTYKVYVNNTLTESWSTDTNYSKIEIINSDSTSFTVNNYTHYNLTSLGTDYTDGLGTASYEYSSAGVGDVVFYAGCEGILSSEIYVSDIIFFDDATTDKSSDYYLRKINGNSTCAFSYDSTNKVYVCEQNKNISNSDDQYGGYWVLELPSTSNHCIVSAKMKWTPNNQNLAVYNDTGLGKWNEINNLGGVCYNRIGNYDRNRYTQFTHSGNTHIVTLGGFKPTENVYYIYEMEINQDGTFTYRVYDETHTTKLYELSNTFNANVMGGANCICVGWHCHNQYIAEVSVEEL